MKPTIVTAFFDIGRGNWTNGPSYLKRTTDDYFNYFNRLLKLDNQIILFTTSDMAPRITPQDNLIVYYFDHWKTLFPKIAYSVKEIQTNPRFLKNVQQPWNPEYWSTDYIMVNFLKTFFVEYAISNVPDISDMVAWIDFGYAKEERHVPVTSWEYDFDPEKIHLFSIKQNVPLRIDIMGIIATNDVFIQGCHVVAHKKHWKWFHMDMIKYMEYLINWEIIDDDQTLLLLCYIMNPEKYEIHYIDPKDWFVMFSQFNNVKALL